MMTHGQFAADAAALASHLGFDRVAVLGHSYGGYIALEFALSYPQRLSHLILVDTAPARDFPEEVMANAERKGATEEMMAILEADRPDSAKQMRRQMQTILPLYFKTFDPDTAHRLTANVLLNPSGGAAEGERASYDVKARLPEISVPTLILVGRDDFICPPSQAHILHEGIHDSELVIFEDSGHFPYVEEPTEFFQAIQEWSERVS